MLEQLNEIKWQQNNQEISWAYVAAKYEFPVDAHKAKKLKPRRPKP